MLTGKSIMDDPIRVTIDEKGFVVADGVKLGLLVRTPGNKAALQICDKNPDRIRERGTRFVQVDLNSIADLGKDNNEPT